jgi:adenylate cyclase class 2
MKTEIETRFLDIGKLNALDHGEKKLDEIIFYDKELTWQKLCKLVRLRKNGDTIKLTFKNNKEQTTTSAKEIEFEVPQFTEAKEFLEAVGLVAYRTIEKYQHSFTLDGVTIDIDTWPKIPVYAELEGDSIESLMAVAEKLGLSWENRFDGDARFVYKKYGFDFDIIRTATFAHFE